jgi:penicillin-binding protein 1A
VRVGTVTGRVLLTQEERFNPKRLPASEFAKTGAALRVSLAAEPEPGAAPVPLRLELGPQSALVAIDLRTRQVLALVGSHEALAGGLDRATRARRQPGSAFKPFLYSYALHSRRFTPATVLDLAADPAHKDPARRISVRNAVAQSDNGAALHVLQDVGAANVVQWAQALGIESHMAPTPSLALGAYEVTPLEITAAYASFASGGEFASPTLVTRIQGPDGTDLSLPPQPPRRRVMGEDEAYLTTSLLRSVVKEGTGRRAGALARPVAGKTGTTNDAKDAWFVGYSTEIVTAVWVGYDDALPLGWGETGGVTALPGWVDFMKTAHEKRPATEFPRPGNIIVAKVDPASGLLAFEGQEDAVDEEFLDGSAPNAVAVADAGSDAAMLAVQSEAEHADAAPTLADGGTKAVPRDPSAPIAVAGGDAGPSPEPPPF